MTAGFFPDDLTLAGSSPPHISLPVIESPFETAEPSRCPEVMAMTDLFGARGNGRPWRTLRASFAARLPLPCARCGLPVLPGSRWHLGHRVDRVNGGTHEHGVWPEHERCSTSAGGRTGTARRQGRGAYPGPSRDW